MAVSISLSIAQNSQSVANNTSNVTVKVTAKWTGGSNNRTGQCTGSITIDGTKYSFSNITFNDSVTTSGSKVVMTKTVNVSHNTDGTKVLACSASFVTGVSSGTVSCSGSKTLTTIPRKSSLSVSNGTLGTAQTLTVTRQATSFTHTIKATCGTESITICDKSTSTSISFTPPLSWASQNTTGLTVSASFTITTYNGSTSVGSNSYTKTFSIPASVKPSVSLTVSDPMGYADYYGEYIQGASKLKIVVTASGNQGSTIKSYKTVADGKAYTAATVTTAVISGSGSMTITATVTDSRGRTATASKTISVYPYEPPRITALSTYRSDANGTASSSGAYMAVVFSTEADGLSFLKGISYIVRYKKRKDTVYTENELSGYDSSPSVSNALFVFPAETTSSYDVVLTVSDHFTNVSKTAVAAAAKKVCSLLKKAGEIVGFAFNKVAEYEGVFEIAFQTLFTGGLLHPVLEPETDLDDVRTPNTYVGANVSSYNYANCPLTSGTFTLEVVGMGEAGQVKQRITYCHKTEARAWERIYYGESWGEWVCVSDFGGKLLWSGGWYMTAGHTITLPEPVSKQRSGIVLVFSEYLGDGTADNSFHCESIPKMFVAMHSGKPYCVQLTTNNLQYFATKTLYITDTQITGDDYNNKGGTGVCGISFTNTRFVLRYVIGV